MISTYLFNFGWNVQFSTSSWVIRNFALICAVSTFSQALLIGASFFFFFAVISSAFLFLLFT